MSKKNRKKGKNQNTVEGYLFIDYDQESGKLKMEFRKFLDKKGKKRFYSEVDDDLFHQQKVIETRVEGKPIKATLEDGMVLHKVETKAPEQSTPSGDTPRENKGFDIAFDASKCLMPSQTRDVLEGTRSIDNFHLQYYKGARKGTNQDDQKFAVLDQYNDKKSGHQLGFDFGKVSLPFAALSQRQLHHAQAIGFSEKKHNLINLEAQNDWRWIVGMGNASVYENGITLHHILGIPYIPASGVKGLLRTVIIKECFEGKEDTALQNALFRAIFGHGDLEQAKHGLQSSGQQGGSVFFDAFPSSKPRLEPDIINSHYDKYYQSEDNEIIPPADWLEPVPVFFMSVKGGQLKFRIGLHNAETTIGEDGMHMEAAHFGLSAESTRFQFMQAWLKYALSEHGIGAKTAVGYGRMEAIV